LSGGAGGGGEEGGVQISASCCDLTSTVKNLTACVQQPTNTHTRTHRGMKYMATMGIERLTDTRLEQ